VTARLRGKAVRHPGRVRIGTSGYQYDDWRGRLYPRNLQRREWLGHYASRFDTVEINNTFYRLPEAETFAAWRAQTPRGFCFALKFNRYGSHMKRLREPAATIGRFFERAGELGSALGPVLLQLPPRWHADPERLDTFLAASPRRVRWAVEFRDPSWLVEPVFAVLRRRRAALCIHDLLDDHPRASSISASTGRPSERATRGSVWSRRRAGSAAGQHGVWTSTPTSTTTREVTRWRTRATCGAMSPGHRFAPCRESGALGGLGLHSVGPRERKGGDETFLARARADEPRCCARSPGGA